MQLELFASVDEREGRVEAHAMIAGYMDVNDAVIGLSELYELGDDDEPDYDADEVFEFITGERVPACCYAEFREGDLFLEIYENCDPEDPSSVIEAFERLQLKAGEVGLSIVWLEFPEVLKREKP